jgi:hypothetical protein
MSPVFIPIHTIEDVDTGGRNPAGGSKSATVKRSKGFSVYGITQESLSLYKPNWEATGVHTFFKQPD